MKTAIKNMTIDQLRRERDRLDDQQAELDLQYDALKARWDGKSVLIDGWNKRMNKIAHRLLEISRGATPEDGEVDSLFALQDKLFERYEMRARERWGITRAMQAIDKPMNALYRRWSNVQTRIIRLRLEAQQVA